MAEASAIEWCDSTFNPWIGCTRVSPGCDHCYAAVSTPARTLGIEWGPHAERRRTAASTWRQARRWNAQHKAFQAVHGRRRRVFCASLADVFDNQVPVQWRMDLFGLIAETPHLDWLILTKRIGNVMPMCSGDSLMFDLLGRNVWLGATVVNQAEADRDIPKLMAVPARVRFLSIEPMLGPIDLHYAFGIPSGAGRGSCPMHLAGVCPEGLRPIGQQHLHWVICGGESGPQARPMHPDWARQLREQCFAAKAPFFFKQWGEWLPWVQFSGAGIEDGDGAEPTKFETREWVDGSWRDVGKPDYWDSMDGAIDDEQCAGRVGKKAAGRLLDGRTHDAFPTPPRP